MNGNDIERLLSSINKVLISASDAANAIANSMEYQLHTRIDVELDSAQTSVSSSGSHSPEGSGTHNHPAGSIALGPHKHLEQEVDSSKRGPDSSDFLAEVVKIKSIENKLYVDKDKMENSLGSPYAEIYNLEKRIKDCYADATSYIGGKASLSIKNLVVVSAAVDAKWAVIKYQDYLQRGYDHVHNNDNQSIMWDDFVDGTSTGNVQQT